MADDEADESANEAGTDDGADDSANEAGTDDGADDSANEAGTDDGAAPAGTVELLALLDAQYGDRYESERREELRDSVASLRGAAESLHETELQNGDEPAFTFAAYRGEE